MIQHKYPLWLQIIYITQAIVAGLFGLGGYALVISITFGGMDTSGLITYHPVGVLVASTLLICAGISLSAYHTEIVVTSTGLRVRVFFLFWRSIDWSDLVEFVVFNPRNQYSNASYWHGIRLRRLSIFHRFLSLSHNVGWRPILMFNYRLNDVKSLLSAIQAHMPDEPRQ